MSTPFRNRLRLWFEFNGVWMGVVIGIAGTALVLGALTLLFVVPIGAPGRQSATVSAFGTMQAEEGAYPTAVLTFDDHKRTVILAKGHPCRVGDVVDLQYRRVLVGKRYGGIVSACVRARTAEEKR